MVSDCEQEARKEYTKGDNCCSGNRIGVMSLEPEEIAKKCLHYAGAKFQLINISNRGTQVWPTGSVYTNLVNQCNVRFESKNSEALTQQDVIGLYLGLSADFKICSIELLNMWGDKRGYSLAQGQ